MPALRDLPRELRGASTLEDPCAETAASVPSPRARPSSGPQPCWGWDHGHPHACSLRLSTRTRTHALGPAAPPVPTTHVCARRARFARSSRLSRISRGALGREGARQGEKKGEKRGQSWDSSDARGCRPRRKEGSGGPRCWSTYRGARGTLRTSVTLEDRRKGRAVRERGALGTPPGESLTNQGQGRAKRCWSMTNWGHRTRDLLPPKFPGFQAHPRPNLPLGGGLGRSQITHPSRWGKVTLTSMPSMPGTPGGPGGPGGPCSPGGPLWQESAHGLVEYVGQRRETGHQGPRPPARSGKDIALQRPGFEPNITRRGGGDRTSKGTSSPPQGSQWGWQVRAQSRPPGWSPHVYTAFNRRGLVRKRGPLPQGIRSWSWWSLNTSI